MSLQHTVPSLHGYKNSLRNWWRRLPAGCYGNEKSQIMLFIYIFPLSSIINQNQCHYHFPDTKDGFVNEHRTRAVSDWEETHSFANCLEWYCVENKKRNKKLTLETNKKVKLDYFFVPSYQFRRFLPSPCDRDHTRCSSLRSGNTFNAWMLTVDLVRCASVATTKTAMLSHLLRMTLTMLRDRGASHVVISFRHSICTNGIWKLDEISLQLPHKDNQTQKHLTEVHSTY